MVLAMTTSVLEEEVPATTTSVLEAVPSMTTCVIGGSIYTSAFVLEEAVKVVIAATKVMVTKEVSTKVVLELVVLWTILTEEVKT